MSSVSAALRGIAQQQVLQDPSARKAAWFGTFVLATALSAQVAVPVPLSPVPVTLQPLCVILAGLVLGPRLGAAAMLTYVTIGALGAPVFSNGAAGLPWLFGPTGGYLLAAPAAAFAAGAIAGGSRGARAAIGLTVGVAVMYAGGVSQLMALTGQDFVTVLGLGVAPFLVADGMKIALAFLLARSIRPLGGVNG